MNANEEYTNALSTVNTIQKMENNVQQTSHFSIPYVRIVEQPRGQMGFTKHCKGRTTPIVGESSTSGKKTYPTIEILNAYQEAAFIVVSCVTGDWPHRPHPNRIVGRGNPFRYGVYFGPVLLDKRAPKLPPMSIQWLEEDGVEEAIEERKQGFIDPFMTGYLEDAGSFDLNCVRLCYQAFLMEGGFPLALQPIISEPIYHEVDNLHIRWMSDRSSSVAGGKVICVLCDKVERNNIEVVFFCEKSNWEETAELSGPACHEQVALVVKTPRYFDQNLFKAVTVKVMLRKPSNGATSASIPFEYLPDLKSIKAKEPAKSIRYSKSPRIPVSKKLKRLPIKKRKLIPLKELRVVLTRVPLTQRETGKGIFKL